MKKQYKRILICFGTRPEVIKVAPIIKVLEENKIKYTSVFTGQHSDLFDDVSDLIPKPDYKLSIMKTNQSLSDILISISNKFVKILKEVKAVIIDKF